MDAPSNAAGSPLPLPSENLPPPTKAALPGGEMLLDQAAELPPPTIAPGNVLLDQGLVHAAEQYLLAADHPDGGALSAGAQPPPQAPTHASPPPTVATTAPAGQAGTVPLLPRHVSASVQTGPTAASAGVQAGGGLQAPTTSAPSQSSSGLPRPSSRPQLILPRPPTPRSTGVPTASPRFFLPSGAAVTVTTAVAPQQRHAGAPRGGHSAPGTHPPTVFRVELNANAPPRPPLLSPLGSHVQSGTPGGGSSHQWGPSVTTPLGSSASSGLSAGAFSQQGGFWGTPPQTENWSAEGGEGGGMQGLYSPLSLYSAASPRDSKPPRGGFTLRARGRGRGRGRGRSRGEESGIFGAALTPGFLLASTNAIQEAVQRTVAGMTPEQVRQVARLYGVALGGGGESLDASSPGSVVSQMVSVFSQSAEALRGVGAQQAPPQGGRKHTDEERPPVEGGEKESNKEGRVGADVEAFVQEAIVEPKETSKQAPNEAEAGGKVPEAVPSNAAPPADVAPAGGMPTEGGGTGTEASKPPPKPQLQVPPHTGPEGAEMLTPRTVLAERVTPPSSSAPAMRQSGGGESALDSMFPASRFVVQEAMQKAVAGIQQDHSAVMGRAMMAGNLGLVQAAVATAEARLTAVFNIAVKEVAEQIGREAAARVMAAENRAAQAERTLKDTKEQAMAMIKRIQDSFQRRLAQVESRAAQELKKAVGKKKRARAPGAGAKSAAAEAGATQEPAQAGEKEQPQSPPALVESPNGVRASAAVAATPKRRKRRLVEDEPISKLRRLLSARAKPRKPRPRAPLARPGLEIMRAEPKLGLLSVVAEVMDSGKVGVKTSPKKGGVKQKRVKKVRTQEPMEGPSETESDEESVPIAQRKKQDKSADAPPRISSVEDPPVVRLAKLPAGLEKAIAARAAERGGDFEASAGGGESEATVVETAEGGEEAEASSPGPKTKSVNALAKRLGKRSAAPTEGGVEPAAKIARTTRQDAAMGRTKSGRKTTSAFVRQSARQLDKGGEDMDSRNKRRLMQGARQLLAMAKMRR